jgi:Uma2 family endonuclease
MVQAASQLKTFEDFLAQADELEGYFELCYGELVEMPPESFDNVTRAKKLERALQAFLDLQQVVAHVLALAVPGQPRNRYPDLVVLRPEHIEQMRALGLTAIALEMAPPLLVVEVVSPGPENHRRDYREKRNQYEWRGIPEYWIVDPEQGQVTVLVLTENGYDETIYTADAVVSSPGFPDWSLTAEAMLAV